MILDCPSCFARFLLPPGAVGPEGRTVRCSKCGHVWHQDYREERELGLSGVEQAEEVHNNHEDELNFQKLVESMGGPIPSSIRPDHEPNSLREHDSNKVMESGGATGGFFRRMIRYVVQHSISLLAGVMAGALVVAAVWTGYRMIVPAGPDVRLEQVMFERIQVARNAGEHGDMVLQLDGQMTNFSSDILTLPPLMIKATDANGKVLQTWQVAAPEEKIGPEMAMPLSYKLKIDAAAAEAEQVVLSFDILNEATADKEAPHAEDPHAEAPAAYH